MTKKGDSFFWPSFADLMTSLFFIMLVLYVLTFVKLKLQQRATEEQLNKIREIQASVKELPQQYFIYQSAHKRFMLNQQIHFGVGESHIKETYKNYLYNVGKSIQNLITKLKSQYQNENIKYLIVIEGMASHDGYAYNDELSYSRALSLYKFWSKQNIKFDTVFCELQIAGSGARGIGRFVGDETMNQRFLIQIVPKIGDIQLE